MTRKILVFLTVAALLTPTVSAYAQEKRFELSPTVGYRFGGSFDVRGTDLLSKGSFKDGVSYGLALSYALNRQFSLEAMWNRQQSALNVEGGLVGPGKVKAFDMKIDQWHGNFIWHAYNRDPKFRPFFLLGLGVTNFITPSDFENESKFSFALGGGVKYYVGDAFGLRFQGRWTPTYINSSPAYWCYLYCYVVEDAHYASQFDVSASAIIRF